jgi:hypothetical protein
MEAMRTPWPLSIPPRHGVAGLGRTRWFALSHVVDQIGKFRPPALVSGGVHIGQVIGHDFGIVLLRHHSRCRYS